MATDLSVVGQTGETPQNPLVDYAIKRFEREFARWNKYVPMWTECYEFCMPQRDNFYQVGMMEGDKRGAELFDMTAITSVSEFASRMQSGIMPPFVRWADFRTGSQVPPSQRNWLQNKLDEICDFVFEVLRYSNLDAEIHECFLDLAVGHSTLLVEEGDTIDRPLRFLAVPMTSNIWGMGPTGEVDANFRIELLKADQLQQRFPRVANDSNVRTAILEGDPERNFEVIHATWKVWAARDAETHMYLAFLKDSKTVLAMHQYQGDGSCPYINFRWTKAAGELYGRGPLMQAIPAVKTVNAIQYDMLQAGELATAGMWQVDDDGVVNVNAIKIEPRVVIPIAPNSRGLQPLLPASNIRWGDYMLEQLRMDIKRALYDEMLGPPEGTPMSATEVRERQADMARRIGSPFVRLQSELVQPLLKRVIFILQRQGFFEVPKVNGREVKIVSVSPLAKAQEQESVRNIYAWLELLAQHYGPEIAAVASMPEEVAAFSAERMGIPMRVVRQAQQAAQILAQQRAAMAGMLPAPGA